jgi:Cellulase (glycosyl hydrolase family 5)
MSGGEARRAHRWRRLLGAFATVGGAVLAASPGAMEAASVRPVITIQGVHFVTPSGSPVVLRGVDVSYHSRYITMVPQLGANFVRLRVLWRDMEPARGVFDQAELSQLDAVVAYLAAHHIATDLDLRGAPLPAWFGSPLGFWTARARASQAAYAPFVRTIVQRYRSDPYVIGYGIFNEPHPFVRTSPGSPAIDQAILSWQAPIRDEILRLDPSRVVFFSVRGGNLGIKHASFTAARFGLAHAVFDWHDFYNGRYGSGFDAQNENWIPSWPVTHNQLTIPYTGSQLNQWRNLAIPWARTHQLGIPMIVGEWGVRTDDANRAVYDAQMAALFQKTGLSWARWDMDSQSLGLIHGGALNSEGTWLAGYLRSSP